MPFLLLLQKLRAAGDGADRELKEQWRLAAFTGWQVYMSRPLQARRETRDNLAQWLDRWGLGRDEAPKRSMSQELARSRANWEHIAAAFGAPVDAINRRQEPANG